VKVAFDHQITSPCSATRCIRYFFELSRLRQRRVGVSRRTLYINNYVTVDAARIRGSTSPYDSLGFRNWWDWLINSQRLAWLGSDVDITRPTSANASVGQSDVS
jgi:hypothetical protein